VVLYFGTKSSTFDTNVFYDHDIFFSVFWCNCTQVNIMFLMLLWVYIHTGQAEKLGIEPATFGILVQCSANWIPKWS
jgi:hypothetical protein